MEKWTGKMKSDLIIAGVQENAPIYQKGTFLEMSIFLGQPV